MLLVNPAARRAADAAARVRAVFEAAGAAYEEVHSAGTAPAAALLARPSGAGVRAIVVVGGDGTVMDVAGALAHTGCPIAIVPAGTGNLVARALGVPADIAGAARVALTGVAARYDLGRLRAAGQASADIGRRFAFSVSVGVDARMIATTEAGAKRRFGIGAYALTAVRCAVPCRPFRARITVDGEVVERDAAEVMIANIGSVLNDLLVLGPAISPADGRLDLCVYTPSNLAQTADVVWRLWRQRFEAPNRLVYRAGRAFRVECDPPQVVQADGELIGTTPFEAVVDAGAATFVVPRPR